MHAVRPASGTKRRRLRLDRDEREGTVATLPKGLVVRDGENIILCEAFFRYEPVVFQEIIKQTTVQRFAVFRPRYGALDVIYP